MHDPNESCFDTWLVLINLTSEQRVVSLIKTGTRIFSLKNFIRYVGENQNRNICFLDVV